MGKENEISNNMYIVVLFFLYCLLVEGTDPPLSLCVCDWCRVLIKCFVRHAKIWLNMVYVWFVKCFYCGFCCLLSLPFSQPQQWHWTLALDHKGHEFTIQKKLNCKERVWSWATWYQITIQFWLFDRKTRSTYVINRQWMLLVITLGGCSRRTQWSSSLDWTTTYTILQWLYYY